MTFPVTTHDTTSQSVPSPGGAMPGSSVSAQTPERTSKTAQLRWLGINALAGAILGLLIYHIDALARWAIRLLM